MYVHALMIVSGHTVYTHHTHPMQGPDYGGCTEMPGSWAIIVIQCTVYLESASMYICKNCAEGFALQCYSLVAAAVQLNTETGHHSPCNAVLCMLRHALWQCTGIECILRK